MSIRDIPLTTISGSTTTLAEHQDKVVIVVFLVLTLITLSTMF